jgi:hypothetical protein
METNIKIGSSSSDEIYTVSFKVDNGLISINCNCQAGLVKMLCKHRLNLLGGDISSMVDKSEEAALTDILSKIDKTKISDLYTDLNKVELELKKLEAERKKLRKEIGLKFSNGF